MLRIKVFQNGVNRVYNTNTFKGGGSGESEFYNFLEVITNVSLGNKILIGFKDMVTNTKVFISPVACLIEVEEVAGK